MNFFFGVMLMLILLIIISFEKKHMEVQYQLDDLKQQVEYLIFKHD